jgi:hypothetical protein
MTVRRGGIGREMMDIAVATGSYQVQLLPRSDRGPAHRFDESCGYRRYL